MRGFIPSTYQVSIDAYKLLLSYSLANSIGTRKLDADLEDKLSNLSTFLILRSEQRNSVFLGSQFAIGERVIARIEIKGPSIENVVIIQNVSVLDKLYQNYRLIGELLSKEDDGSKDVIDKSKPYFEEFLEYLCKSRFIGLQQFQNSLLIAQTKFFDSLWGFGKHDPLEIPMEMTVKGLRVIIKNSLSDEEFEKCLSSLTFSKEQALMVEPWNVGEREDTNLFYRPIVLIDDEITIYLPILVTSFLCLSSREIFKIQSKSFDGIPFEGSVEDYLTKLGCKILTHAEKNILPALRKR